MKKEEAIKAKTSIFGIRLLSVVAMLVSSIKSTCPRLSIGSSIHEHDVMIQGSLQPFYSSQSQIPKRKVIRRDIEYFYLTLQGGSINVSNTKP